MSMLKGKTSRGKTLLFAVFLAMSFGSFLSIMPRMKCVARGRVSMMCRFLVVSSIVMLCCFTVMTSCVRVMFRCLFMMFCSFF